MGKACGIIAAGSVLTALLCWVNLGQSAEAVRPPAGNRSAAELLADGKAKYLNGQYAAAVKALEAAEAQSKYLHSSQRLDVQAYLKRARQRQEAEAGDSDVTVRAQSPGRKPSDPAHKMMRDANAAALKGDLRTAKELAIKASQFETEWGPNEVSPEQFLQSLGASRPAPARAAPTRPTTTRSIAVPQQSPAVPATNTVRTLPAEETEDRQSNARELLASARQSFNYGHLAVAKRSALAVRRMGVKTRWLEDSPEKLLQDIAAHEAHTLAWQKDNSSPKALSDRSKYLLNRASQLIEEGEVEIAVGYLQEAESLPAERAVTDPKPEHVREQLARKGVHVPGSSTATVETPETLAATAAPPARSMPQPRTVAQTRTAVAPTDETRRKIATMMRNAYACRDKGDLAGAFAHAANAKRLAEYAQVQFAENEESPELFLSSLKAGSTPRNVATAQPKAAPAIDAGPLVEELPIVTPAETEFMPADDVDNALVEAEPTESETMILLEDEPQRLPASPVPGKASRAQQLLAEAKAALDAGDAETARLKAEEADRLDATYELLDERPEHVLAEVQSKTGTAVATDSKADRERAVSLVNAARDAYKAGQYAEARQMAEEASAIDVAYGLLEDTPDKVLFDVARLGRKALNPAHVAEATPSEEPRTLPAQVAAEEPATSPRKLPGAELIDEEPAVAEAATEAMPSEVEPLIDIAEAPAVATELEPISPKPETALELYDLGVAALRSRQIEEAYHYFKAAAESGEKLDGPRARFVQEKLAELSPRFRKRLVRTVAAQGTEGTSDVPAEATTEVPHVLETVVDDRKLAIEKLRSEVINQKFKAERVSDTDPDAALEIIDNALLQVENSNLDETATTSLLRNLATARTEIERKARLKAPITEAKKRNQEVVDIIKTQREHEIRIEQELAEKVEKFNQLNDEGRYEEAMLVAKEAKALAPENPVTIVMYERAKIAKQVQFNQKIKDGKADLFTDALNDVDESAAMAYTNSINFGNVQNWKDLTARRLKYGRPDSRAVSPQEEKIRKSLGAPISLHFQNAPLGDVIKQIQIVANVNLHLDEQGLQEEGVTTANPISINVDEIRIQSVLALVLEPLNLGYIVQNDVLKITSKRRCAGEMLTVNYSVADLIIPIPNFTPAGGMGLSSAGGPNGPRGGHSYPFGGQMNVGPQHQGMFQVADEAPSSPFPNATNNRRELGGGGTGADFGPLIDLITTTIDPDTWDEVGGAGSVSQFDTTLSLVVRQTQSVHDQIADLLSQLRRLQDLQVTIEVRFITISDNFFERIGIDFDFNVQDSAGDDLPPTFGQFLPPFGQGFPNQGTGQQQGQQAQQQQGGSGSFNPGPPRDLIDRDNYPKYGTLVGRNSDETFTDDLDIPFTQGSFQLGVPQFGGFQADAGLTMGLAILSDIETFFLINASQGDDRANLMFAPKVTLFNGQVASIQDTVQRPFVTSLIPTVGFFSVGFQPQITVISDGVTMQVQAVISADRRYVRLTVSPVFTTLTDVQTFSFVSGIGAGTQGGATGNQQGNQGGFGGGQFGQGGFGGLGGIGGQGQAQQGQQGQQGQQQQQQGQAGAATQVTVQQPIVEFINVGTTVSVPDGGTVLLGGIKRLREGRTMAGVPILNKIPYVSRLFKNTGVGRETESLMLMVTPRIIILEEEEELLGIPLE